MSRCGKFVSWWDGEYEGNCELPEGHRGHHFDGMSWYDDDGDRVTDPPSKEPPPVRVRLAAHDASGRIEGYYECVLTDLTQQAVLRLADGRSVVAAYVR